mmetsp:Transcript_18039/g.20832  ORF Transcript_18039/g.20832 Transcript_18039/m.20832 type:complete len:269 (-) Transcript_18039:43-849(-)
MRCSMGRISVGAVLIAEAGKCLSINRHIVSTALLFFHQLKNKATLNGLHVCAIISIACKVEEQPLKIRDILNVCGFVSEQLLKEEKTKPRSKDQAAADSASTYYFQVPQNLGDEYLSVKSSVEVNEQKLIEILDFSLVTPTSPSFLAQICVYLDVPVQVCRTSWCILNDSFLSDACVEYESKAGSSSKTLSSACLYVAVMLIKRPDGDLKKGKSISGFAKLLEMDSVSTEIISRLNFLRGCEWWKIFGVSNSELEAASNRLLEIYSLH